MIHVSTDPHVYLDVHFFLMDLQVSVSYFILVGFCSRFSVTMLLLAVFQVLATAMESVIHLYCVSILRC